MKSINKGNGQVLLAGVRLSYAHLFDPKALAEGQEPNYSVSLLIDKQDAQTVAVIEKAIDEAREAGKENKWKGKLPKGLKEPLRDGDEERDDEAYQGHYFFNASSKQKPGVLNERKQPATEDDVYSGCYAYVTVNFYPFDAAGNRGIAAGLNNVMKYQDGERLAGVPSADDDFADIEVNDDDIADLI